MRRPARRSDGPAARHVALAGVFLALAAGCGRAPTPDGGADLGTLPADTASRAAPARPEEVRAPYAPNGAPMPLAAEAAGIPPYPNAIVHVRTPRRSDVDYLEAFTPDPWEVVVEYYARRLGDWTMTRAEDTVVFELVPDRAAVTVQPWEAEALPPDADPVLRNAQTAIGTAWR